MRLTTRATAAAPRSGAAACAALLALCALAACDLGQGRLPVRKVLVDVDPAAASGGVDREAVRGIVHAQLGKARGVKMTEGIKEGAVLRVHIESFAASTPDQGRTLSLGVEVTGAPEEGRIDASYRGHSVASAKGEVPIQTLVEQALRDALAQVLSTRGAAELSSKELIAWLSDANATDEQRRRAVRILGTRRERDAAPVLNQILLGEDEELARNALVAVTNIGDPLSVPAVIRYAERQPTLVRKQAIDAVRAMGTREGMAWLFTLSTGHPDVEVQKQAASALAAIEGPEPASDAAAVAAATDAKGAEATGAAPEAR